MEKLYNLKDCGAETKKSKSGGSSNQYVNEKRKFILEKNENGNKSEITLKIFNLSI